MIICHVCNAECEDGLELCPICGAELQVVAEQMEGKEESSIMENPTILTSFEDIVSAEIFKDILKDNGIPFTSSSDMGDNSIQVVFGGNFVAEDIYVSEKDFEKANELYEEFLNSEADFEGEFIEEIEEEY